MAHPSRLVEDDIIAALDETSILDTIARCARLFEMQHGEPPTIIYINKSLRVAISVELIRDLGMPAEMAIAFPFVMDRIPVNLADNLADTTYIKLIHHGKRIMETL